MSQIELGQALPPNTPHAVSVSLPTWRDNIGYEEGDQRVWQKMITGYPRFFIHKSISLFAEAILKNYGNQSHQKAMLFPSTKHAKRCVEFILSRENSLPTDNLIIVDLVVDPNQNSSDLIGQVSPSISPSISAVLLPIGIFLIARQYWQHSGEGISSRHAEFCHYLFQRGFLIEKSTLKPNFNGYHKACKGPRRYQKEAVSSHSANLFLTRLCEKQEVDDSNDYIDSEIHESSQFLEERFGRNLDVSFVESAKLAIRRRIAGCLTGEDLILTSKIHKISNARGTPELTENDVYLWPCGMNSIFHSHRMLIEARGANKSICFGFPYVDTLKLLEKFGPGCVFYGDVTSEDLDHLEMRLKSGEKYLALFCEFPGNPLLRCPDLLRIRNLANTYDFAVVIDETIGNFINVDVLPYADVIVSSLSKIFSGECNVLGGSSILNPNGRYYNNLKMIANRDYEDNYWAEDAIFMERNSRNFIPRIERINQNAEAICSFLEMHPLVKHVYYPKCSLTKENYDACRTPNGRYGGLLSFKFQNPKQAIAFFDRIELSKGPSLGTNFTLVSPYVILAHFLELKWAAQFGVHEDLIRVSIGLENKLDLLSRFEDAMKAAGEVEI